MGSKRSMTERKQALGALYLAEKAIEQLGWPAVFVIVAVSDAGTEFIELLRDLLTLGPWHFWSFVALAFGVVMAGSLSRRQARTVRDQAEQLRQMANTIKYLKSELRRYREDQESHR